MTLHPHLHEKNKSCNKLLILLLTISQGRNLKSQIFLTKIDPGDPSHAQPGLLLQKANLRDVNLELHVSSHRPREMGQSAGLSGFDDLIDVATVA